MFTNQAKMEGLFVNALLFFATFKNIPMHVDLGNMAVRWTFFNILLSAKSETRWICVGVACFQQSQLGYRMYLKKIFWPNWTKTSGFRHSKIDRSVTTWQALPTTLNDCQSIGLNWHRSRFIATATLPLVSWAGIFQLLSSPVDFFYRCQLPSVSMLETGLSLADIFLRLSAQAMSNLETTATFSSPDFHVK